MRIKQSPTPWIAEKSRSLVGPAAVVAPIAGSPGCSLILAQGSWADCNLIAAAPAMKQSIEQLLVWIEATGIKRMPAFAGMNIQPLLDAQAVLVAASSTEAVKEVA